MAATKTFEWEHDIDLFNNKKPDDKEPVEEEETVESWFARAKNRARFWDRQNNPDPNKAIDESQYWISDIEEVEPIFDRETDIPDYEQDDGPLTDEQVKHIRELAKDELPTGEVITKESLFTDPSSPGWMFVDKLRPSEVVEEVDPLEIMPAVIEQPDPTLLVVGDEYIEVDGKRIHHKAFDPRSENATHAVERHIEKLQPELLDVNPVNNGNLWTPQADGSWANAGPMNQFALSELGLVADNAPDAAVGEMRGFGTSFPATADKGDMFLRVDQLPSALYKFNGVSWIEVDKTLSDQHAYDDAYIDHLIEKISTGEYDPELLSNAERDSIERKLNTNPRQV